MKSLNDLAVLQAAETLMYQNGQTTTLDVKNLLRQQGYEATQAEVSSRMEMVSKQESWNINSAGAYKIYKLPPDSTQTIHAYWEHNLQRLFWEIQVGGKQISVVTGKIGTDGTVQISTYNSNREAIREAQLLMQQKKTEGYQVAQDTRLPLEIRKYFATHFVKTPQSITLAYFGVVQNIGNTQKEGGYEFSWDLPTEQHLVQEILDKKTWSPLDYQKTYSKCLGEKITAFVVASPDSFEVKQDNLFQAYLKFTDGTSLKIGRYDAVFADKQNPRQPSFTFWSTVKRFLTTV